MLAKESLLCSCVEDQKKDRGKKRERERGIFGAWSVTLREEKIKEAKEVEGCDKNGTILKVVKNLILKRTQSF